MQIVICYKNESVMEKLRDQVEDYFKTVYSVHITVCTYKQMKELLNKKTFFCDLLFINAGKALKEESFEIIEETLERIPTCQLICYSELNDLGYYPELFEWNLCYYICIEQSEKLMPIALKKACEALAIQERNCLICKSGYKLVKVFFDDILFVERDQHTTKIHTKDRCYAIKEKLSELESAFEKYPSIIRCHMSFYINLKYANSFCRKKFDMITGECIPVSRKYYKEVAENVQNKVMKIYHQSVSDV
ncbi:MAG: LytTR family DNA-binding domain-containing protein [Lachnospiraceae bacterium]|nr:LytTR family DNA-binding domain-containing protein [Lachnospiraceae bacterium]